MIVFSDHAKTQMARRGIARARVLGTIGNPDDAETSFRSRRLYRKKFRDKMLEVVAIEEGKQLIIITAYYL